MSYAIIRNVKYKRENLKGIYRHNERKNYNYSNRNIDKEKSNLNYPIKEPLYSYEKEFDRLKEKYDLKGQIKTVSNIACEYIITSDKEFFDTIGNEETKRYFETAYQFVSEYKNLGEKYIMSDNRELHNRVYELEEEYKEKSFVLEYEYKNKYHKLEKENKYLHKVIDRFKDTLGTFIKWVCKKFDLGAEDAVIGDFEKEMCTSFDVEK